MFQIPSQPNSLAPQPAQQLFISVKHLGFITSRSSCMDNSLMFLLPHLITSLIDEKHFLGGTYFKLLIVIFPITATNHWVGLIFP